MPMHLNLNSKQRKFYYQKAFVLNTYLHNILTYFCMNWIIVVYHTVSKFRQPFLDDEKSISGSFEQMYVGCLSIFVRTKIVIFTFWLDILIWSYANLIQKSKSSFQEIRFK